MVRTDFIIIAKKVLVGVLIYLIPLAVIGGGLLLLKSIL